MKKKDRVHRASAAKTKGRSNKRQLTGLPRRQADAEFVKKFRESKGWTREQLAKALGLSVRAVYDWEAGSYGPSLEAYRGILELAGATEWEYTRHCVSKLLDDRTYAQILEKEKGLPSTLAAIDSLDDATVQIAFPRPLFGHPEHIRFLRVGAEDIGYFKPGDVVLVDVSETSLSALDDGSFVAVSGPYEDRSRGTSGSYRLLGWLQKQESWQDTSHLSLRMPLGRNVFLGSSVSGRDVIHEHLTILGRVVGWLSQGRRAGDPEKTGMTA